MKYLFHLVIMTLLIALISCRDSQNVVPDGFEIMEGYNLELVASEPLIADPVDLEFDENGDAFVLEMPGYPFEDQHSRIVKLIDQNGDGEYDDKVIYAESLQLASSILPYQKGMLVAGPPYLLFVKDTDGDGRAELRDTLMGGFSTGNLQHNYNGLTYGLDNWIYAANGGNSGNPLWWGDSSTVIDLRGDDMRLDIDSRIIERIGYSSGGYELAIDDFGHIFETHNLEHISQSVFSNKYISDHDLLLDHTLLNISDHEENGLARIYPIGEQESRVNHPEQSGYFSGACGITHYGGGALGNLNGSIWVADVVLNLIHVDQITPNGAAFTASRLGEKRDFLASNDRSFRPVNMTVGPDGSMFIVDMYRQVIEHPEWIPDEIEKTLDLEAGKDKGRIYKVSTVNSDKMQNDFHDTKELVEALSSNNQWVRNTAQRLLLEDPPIPEVTALLKSSLSSENDALRLHALWTLHHLHKLTDAEILVAMKDSEPAIKENVIIISESYIRMNEEFQTQLIGLLSDQNQRVRMQAALSLSTLSDNVLGNLKVSILNRLSEVVVLDMDTWNTAALTLLCKSFANEAIHLIAGMDSFDKKNELLRSLTANAAKTSENAEILFQSLANSTYSNDIKESILTILAERKDGIRKTKETLNSIQSLERIANNEMLVSLAKIRTNLRLSPSPRFIKQSAKSVDIVGDGNADVAQRIEHLKLIDLLPFDKKSKLLYKLLDNSSPLELQSAALLQLWEASDPNIGARLVEKWKDLGPQSRKTASDILLYKEAHHDALLTGLEKKVINIGEMNFDLERRRTLLWWTDNETTKERAGMLFTDSGVINRKDAMDQMKEALDLQGSVEGGSLVFDQLCAQCHMYGNKGNDVGPVLTEIQRKSKESLLHDILDPNAGVDTKYINHKIETTDGKFVFGMVEHETDESVTLINTGGVRSTIQKSNIKSFTSLGTSLMMEGLEANMSHQEMADLLSFLQQPI